MGDEVTCDVCGESECWALADWSMGGAPGEYEEAMAKHWHLGYERSQAALAAARRDRDYCAKQTDAARWECEELRKRVGSIASRLESARNEPDGDCCGSNMAALQRSIGASLTAALAAPAAGPSDSVTDAIFNALVSSK